MVMRKTKIVCTLGPATNNEERGSSCRTVDDARVDRYACELLPHALLPPLSHAEGASCGPDRKGAVTIVGK